MFTMTGSTSRLDSAITQAQDKSATRHLTIHVIGGCEMQKKTVGKYIFSYNTKKVDYMNISGNSECKTMIPTKNKLTPLVGYET